MKRISLLLTCLSLSAIANAAADVEVYHIRVDNENNNNQVQLTLKNYDEKDGGRISITKDTNCYHVYGGMNSPEGTNYVLENNTSCDLYIKVDSQHAINFTGQDIYHHAGKLDIEMSDRTDSKLLLKLTAENKESKDNYNLHVTDFELHGNTGTTAGIAPNSNFYTELDSKLDSSHVNEIRYT